MKPKSLKKFVILLIVKLFLCKETLGIKKIWKGSTSFQNSKSWENEIRPIHNCTNQIIKFPAKLYTSVQLQESLVANQIVLSKDGGFLLGSNLIISLSDSILTDKKCNGQKEFTFLKPEPSQWFSVYNWEPVFNEEDQKYNKATPDTHWIPCENDIVIFPNGSTILIDVNFAPYLNFQEVQINGRAYEQEFQEFMRTELGSSMFLNSFTTSVNAGKCSKNCICEHQNFVCNNIKCKRPFCVDPIKPNGFCCNICGAFISFEVPPKKFDMKNFLRTIKQTLSLSKLDTDAVEYFATFSSEKNVQVIIVDTVDGNDISGEIMKYLRTNLIEKMFKNSTKIYGQSGKSYTPGTISLFHILFFSLLFVTTFLGAFYFYHYGGRDLLENILNRNFQRSQFIFARFDNQRGEEDGAVDIDVVPDDDEEAEVNPSSFNNPLYERKLNVNDVNEGIYKTSPSKMEETELKETEELHNVPTIQLTKFDEVDLLKPSEN